MITDNWKEWLRSTIIRCVWTFAETMLALISTMTFIEEIKWKTTLSASALSFLICFLKCIVTGLPEVNKTNEFYNVNNLPNEVTFIASDRKEK